MKVRLTHLDGKLPNLALMKLAHWHKARGDEVHFTRRPVPTMFEQLDYDRVYGSTIFDWTTPVTERFKLAFPDAIVGGTASGHFATVESLIGEGKYEHYDYSIYHGWAPAIGYTQRGCRLSCKFCVVPEKEGKPTPLNTLAELTASNPSKKVMLLDNDFFGIPGWWEDRIEEIKDGNYRVCFSQGINIRMVNDQVAEALASIQYRDNKFQRRRLYTAWDNLQDEKVFFRGLDRLNRAGIPSKHLMVYMLVGWAEGEDMEQVLYRFTKLCEAGCKPFPMVYNRQEQPELRKFARWVLQRYYEIVPWSQFNG